MTQSTLHYFFRGIRNRLTSTYGVFKCKSSNIYIKQANSLWQSHNICLFVFYKNLGFSRNLSIVRVKFQLQSEAEAISSPQIRSTNLVCVFVLVFVCLFVIVFVFVFVEWESFRRFLNFSQEYLWPILAIVPKPILRMDFWRGETGLYYNRREDWFVLNLYL